MEWLANNIGTIAVALLLAAIVCAVVAKLIRDKKKGKSACSCGCGCESCAMGGVCHKK